MRQINDVPRGFKGIWIPKEIWFSENLTYAEIIILSEINSLDNNETRGCTASNEYLALFLGVKERVIRDHIHSLKEKGYLVQCFFDGRSRGLKVNLITPVRVDGNHPVSEDGYPPVREDGNRKSSISKKKDKIKEENTSSQASEDCQIYNELKDWWSKRYPEHFNKDDKDDWARESPAIKKLVQKARNRFPEAQTQVLKDWIADVIEVFEDMCSGKIKHFIKGSPPIPSRMVSKGTWPYVVEEYAKTHKEC